ncbi:hypothetical protein Tsubulata_026323 [Turnera subulata]|uniref:DUF4283 domain-containing protein n=1 Tax=Turnera subulata TaxID=218843 RepID=A0A9Q0JCN2_9ROSI|nr:hypothetical protein Tsubulata_026323 [Turnera subulata]
MITCTGLVGKIYSNRYFIAGIVEPNMKKVWDIRGSYMVTEKGNIVFLFGFEFEDDCEKVYKGTPWLMSNVHLNLRRWSPKVAFNRIPMRLSWFSAQLYDLPLDFLDYLKIKKKCSVFYATIEIDAGLETIWGWNRFVRVRIEFLPRHPLIAGIHVTNMLDTKHWIKVQYERLGEFYFNCGRITHPHALL